MADGHGALSARQAREAAVYDARFADVAAQEADGSLLMDLTSPPYPNREHVEFLDDMLARMEPLEGRRVLEVGCGSGALSVYVASLGAQVTGLDVSSSVLALARRRAEVNGLAERCRFQLAPIESFDDPAGSYDVVVGNQVLHHFELDEALANVRRLLAPGGIAVFCEPVLLLPEAARRLRSSPVVLRRFPSRADTPDERSIGRAEVERICTAFGRAEMKEYQLLTRLQNFVELSDPVFARLERTDRVLLRYLPPARRLCRYMVFVLSGRPPWPEGAPVAAEPGR
jgi:2-polyprenyl-3-methyl-5-hydroxy-6-metoxy-1,4-benzoquinol methylase